MAKYNGAKNSLGVMKGSAEFLLAVNFEKPPSKPLQNAFSPTKKQLVNALQDLKYEQYTGCKVGLKYPTILNW